MGFLAHLSSYGLDAQIVMTFATSSVIAWTRLNKHYASKSYTHVGSLKGRLSSITKGTSTINDYLRSI